MCEQHFSVALVKVDSLDSLMYKNTSYLMRCYISVCEIRVTSRSCLKCS